jgi:3-oxoacyl-[acyl-carrier protein] reductase
MIEERIAVITGAARGIGLAASRRLAEAGWSIVGIDPGGAAVEKAMVGLRGRCAVADLTDRKAVEEAISEIADSTGRIDALVNCAGITGQADRPAHEVDPDDFDRVYRINLYAAMLLTRAVIPVMLRKGAGRILHVASIAGKEGNVGMTAYSATKAGLIRLVKSAAKDYAETGTTINALAPAVIWTDMVAAMPEGQVRYMTDRIQ